MGIDECFQENVVAPLLVHQSGVGASRVEHVDNRRQFLEVHEDLRGDVLGLRAGRCGAHRDHLADLTHLAIGEHGLFGVLETRQA